MFKNAQRELNELLILVRQTATYAAGLSLDPVTTRADGAAAEYERQQLRKSELMRKYDLNEFHEVTSPRG
jgi:hypothetical protein